MSVIAVSLSHRHKFSKGNVEEITVVENSGVEGDCHKGITVQHRSRLGIRPPPPNLRQVHLIPIEILVERQLLPGDIGDNVATEGLNLLQLSTGTRLKFVNGPGIPLHYEDTAPVLTLTGLRNPCPQIDKFRDGLKESFIVRDAERKIIGRKAGVMAIVERGGVIKKGMKILVEEPDKLSPLIPV